MARVLVVDDHMEAAEGLAELIALWGHDVAVAHDGAGALTIAGRTTVDIVLLDLNLTAESGIELGRRLRDVGGDRVRLVAITGRGGADDRAHTAAAGFERHLTKPVDFGELERFLGSHAAA